MRRTRSRAGTKSSVSLTVSPMTWSALPQQGTDASINIDRHVFARQMLGKSLPA
jgi:hypothetical protein